MIQKTKQFGIVFGIIIILDIINCTLIKEIPIIVCNSLILLFCIAHFYLRIKYKKYEELLLFSLFFHNAVQIYYYGMKSLWFLIYLLQIFKYEKHNKLLKYCKFIQLAISIIIYSIQYDGWLDYAYFQQLNNFIAIFIYQIFNQHKQDSKMEVTENFIIQEMKKLIIFKIFDQQFNELSQTTSKNYILVTSTQQDENQTFQIKAYQDKELAYTPQHQCDWKPNLIFNDYQSFIEHIHNIENLDSQMCYHYVAIQNDLVKKIKTKYKVLYKELGKQELIIIALVRIDNFAEKQMTFKLKKFKKYFYDIFAHKLKTPLNASLGFLSSAYNYLEMDNTIKQNYIKPAYINSKLQYFQISDLLEFLNPQSDQTILQYCKINMKSFLYTLNELIESQCQNKKILFQIYVERVPLNSVEKFYISTDLLKLERILYNLLNLTYRYTPQNGQINLHLSIDQTNSQMIFIINGSGQLFNDEELLKINQWIKSQAEFQYKKKSILLKKEIKLSLEITNHLINTLSDQEQSLEISSSSLGTEFKFRLILKDNKTTEGSQEQFTIGFMLKQKSNKSFKTVTSKQKSHKSTIIELESTSPLSSYKNINEPQANTPIATPINQTKVYKSPTTLKRIRSSFANKGVMDFDKKILIVDDEPFNHDILILMMKNMGYNQFLKAFNGQQAIDLVKEREEEISIIIMDLDMPIMGGIEATKILVDMMFEQNLVYIPIIGCTAHDDRETMDKCIQVGMLYVVVKPVFVKSLIDAFKQITNIDDTRKRSFLCVTSQLQI